MARYGKRLIQFGVAGVLVWAIFYFKIISVRDIVGLTQYPYPLLFFCLCMGVLYILSSVRWYLLLSCQDIAPSFGQTFRITYIGSFWASTLLGGMASEFSRAYMLFRQVPGCKRKGGISILVDKIASLAALLLWVSACVIIKFDLIVNSPLFISVCVFLAIGSVFFVIFIGMLVVNKRRLGVSKWIEERYPNNAIASHVLLIMDSIYYYRSSPKILLCVFAISVFNQAIMIFILYQLGVLLNSYMTFNDIGISGPVTILLNMMPISPGGLGVGEVCFAQVNAMLNASSSMQVSGSVFLTYRILSIVTSLPAVIFLFRRR